ncbi:MAG: TolC family protein [Opitutae bacterium]|nr:TolC family protein [Opitutae bacterium]
MKFPNLFAAMLLLTGGVFAAPLDEVALPERVFTGLDAILKSAVQQSPRMVNRELDLQIAENDRIIARAGLLPSFGASYRYNKSRDTRADVVGRLGVTKTYYDVSISQPLFFWGERRNNARMGEIREKISKGQFRDGYRLLVQELRNQYLQLIVRKVALKRARFNQKFTHDQLAIAEDRLAKKVISEFEIFPLRLNSERADIDLERNVFDYETAKAAFARLAGLGTMGDEAIPDTMPALPYPATAVDGLLAGFLAQKDLPSVEAFSLRNQIAIQELDYLNQKTRLRPKFSFTAGTNQDEQNYKINDVQKFRVNSLYAGIQVQWTLFDGFAAQAARRISLARRRQMENDYRELTDRLGKQAQAQAKQIYFSARNMSINDRFLTSGEGNLKTRQDDFKRGVISEADVSLAQLGLFDAQVNAYNARADYLVRIGDFLGTLAEDPVLGNLTNK